MSEAGKYNSSNTALQAIVRALRIQRGEDSDATGMTQKLKPPDNWKEKP